MTIELRIAWFALGLTIGTVLAGIRARRLEESRAFWRRQALAALLQTEHDRGEGNAS